VESAADELWALTTEENDIAFQAKNTKMIVNRRVLPTEAGRSRSLKEFWIKIELSRAMNEEEKSEN
jgi:hypothetical protein